MTGFFLQNFTIADLSNKNCREIKDNEKAFTPLRKQPKIKLFVYIRHKYF